MYARTTFPGVSAEDEYEIDWPYLDVAHIKATDDGVALSLAGATFEYDKATGVTTITLASGVSGDIVIYRETPIPADLNDYIKRDVDTLHGSSLVMGVQPANLLLLYILQEVGDRFDAIGSITVNALAGVDTGTDMTAAQAAAIVLAFNTIKRGATL